MLCFFQGVTYHQPDYKLAQSGNCYAPILRSEAKWADSTLKISWDSALKAFTLDFKGLSKGTGLSLGYDEDIDAFISRVPLEITEESTCDCGGVLTLVNYTVELKADDFFFQADYFCSKCRKEAEAKATSFMSVVKKWLIGLNKIEIGLKGMKVERQ